MLSIKVAELQFPNPVGLAAGFDKNAEVFAQILRLGFGFAEVGTLTPLPQAGNSKPRLFRLAEDRAVINRMGFRSEEHTSELQSLMRISYAVFCLKKKTITKNMHNLYITYQH